MGNLSQEAFLKKVGSPPPRRHPLPIAPQLEMELLASSLTPWESGLLDLLQVKTSVSEVKFNMKITFVLQF